MTRAYGYTRLSQRSDTSIEAQKKHIQEYADEHGFTVSYIFDEGEMSSGFDTDQLGEYRKMLDGLFEVDALIVNDKRRLVRDIDAVMRLIPNLREHEVELHTWQDGEIDLSDPMRAAIEILQAAAAFEEKMKEIERAVDAIDTRISDGCYQGRPPFGLKFADDKCHLVKDDEEWSVCERIWDTGESPSNIDDVSTTTGYRIRNRGRAWYDDLLDEYGVVA